mmetsp:Transcript_18758/g.28541  ORF Transcript_18758/g.28541 Transcript_18758/m.28541 type:complete len:95 (-) Transcript_18758:651-935(-)
MPRLGTAGKDLAELDIEMNHNSVDVEVCKKGNMEAGKSCNLLQYLQADDEILEKNNAITQHITLRCAVKIRFMVMVKLWIVKSERSGKLCNSLR